MESTGCQREGPTHLVEGEEGFLLVDTGMPGSENRIYKSLDKLGRKPDDVKLVLITHRHLDHIRSVAAIKRATGAILIAHFRETVHRGYPNGLNSIRLVIEGKG